MNVSAHLDFLSSSFDVQCQGVAMTLEMKRRMISVPSAAAIKASKTNIQTGTIILAIG